MGRRTAHLRVTRLPLPAAREEYEAAADEIETRLCDLPGVVATYRTGGVGAPGISDVDVVAVLEPGAGIPAIWEDLSPRTRYLAMHAPFAIDRETFRLHRHFAYVEPLALSRGESVKAEPRPEPEISEPLIGAESLVAATLTLAKQGELGLIKARPLLCELNNLRHSLMLARLEQGDAPAAWELSDAVSVLRDEWFDELDPDSRATRIADLADSAPPALDQALRALGARTAETAGREPEPLKLAAQWSSVTLVSRGGEGSMPRRAPGASLSARSARLSELRWRLRSRSVAVPEGIMSRLTGAAHPETAAFGAARVDLVRRYAAMLAAHAPGYSAVGLAIPFAGR